MVRALSRYTDAFGDKLCVGVEVFVDVGIPETVVAWGELLVDVTEGITIVLQATNKIPILMPRRKLFELGFIVL